MLKAVSNLVNAIGALNYKGTWNASTNTPTLTSGVGTKGDYYVVSVAGTTNLDGETNWGVGDWAVFNGTVWQKVDGGSTGNLTTLTVTGNTYLATTSGDVGVGTSSPANKLEVGGVGKFWTGITGGLGAVALGDNGTATYNVGIFRGAANSISSAGNFLNLGGYDGIVFSASNTVLGSQSERMRITSAGNIVAGASAALATNATDGFLYVPTCAGTPTGTPTAITGMAPIVVDTTNNKLYFYSGGTWRDAGP